jgi:hypothetical protein
MAIGPKTHHETPGSGSAISQIAPTNAYGLHRNFRLVRSELRVTPAQPCNQLGLSHRAASRCSTRYVRERDNRREVRQIASIARERRVRLLRYAHHGPELTFASASSSGLTAELSKSEFL